MHDYACDDPRDFFDWNQIQTRLITRTSRCRDNVEDVAIRMEVFCLEAVMIE